MNIHPHTHRVKITPTPLHSPTNKPTHNPHPSANSKKRVTTWAKKKKSLSALHSTNTLSDPPTATGLNLTKFTEDYFPVWCFFLMNISRFNSFLLSVYKHHHSKRHTVEGCHHVRWPVIFYLMAAINFSIHSVSQVQIREKISHDKSAKLSVLEKAGNPLWNKSNKKTTERKKKLKDIKIEQRLIKESGCMFPN